MTRFSFISLFLGDLLCIVNSITGNETQLDIATIAGPFHGSLSAYAAQEPPCFNKVFSSPSIPVVGFIKYGPVFLMIQVMIMIVMLIIMIIQVMILVTVERISIFFPRMRQKIERFYHSVVEVRIKLIIIAALSSLLNVRRRCLERIQILLKILTTANFQRTKYCEKDKDKRFAGR